jgi:hypothetical protein
VDVDDADGVVCEVVGQFAQAPVREPTGQHRGRTVAACPMKSSSLLVIRLGRPCPHCGSKAVNPLALIEWITSRTVYWSASNSRAIIGGLAPCADARTITARRTRIVS